MKLQTKLAHTVGELLKAEGLTISAAESCTGGLLLSTLTDISGSSAYVMGGVVTYSNEAKQQLVNVQEATLIEHGAVSEATAREMVVGVCQLFDTDLGISITGIAGPGGGTPEKPVGLVYIGIQYREQIAVRRFVWDGNRIENKIHSVNMALEMIQAFVTQSS
ncbi:MAG: CinA family protein [Chloroflexota bacterium]